MRVTIVLKGMPLQELLAVLERLGAGSVKVAQGTGMVFCDLPSGAVASLQSLPGIAVKAIGQVRTQQYQAYGPMTGTNALLFAYLNQAREVLSPPVLGEMWKVAVLDTGVRSSHIMLRDKVVYERNFTSSPTAEDVYDHGTAVAGLVAGGRPAPGEEQGVAPGAQILNLKVIADDGVGSEEAVVLGIEEAIEQGAKVINLSFGSPDDGDPDSPARVACQAAYDAGILVCAAAGNTGPDPGTIMSPACDPKVWAVGALGMDGYVASFSARGPTVEGHVKPDVMFYGERLQLCSAASDDTFVVKSGTSFACAGISGATALLQEGAVRLFGRELTQEENWMMTTLITRKPQTAPQPPNKDNDYGWGMPFGDLAVRAIQPTFPIEQIVSPILSIGMMGALMKGLVPTGG